MVWRTVVCECALMTTCI